MNKQIYRLVFSKRLGMLVPVSEAARSHTCKSSGSRIRSYRKWIALILAGSVQMALAAPGGLIPHATRGWTNANIDAARTNATQMTIKQTASKAYLNWSKLNLNKGESLIFDQNGNRSWSALNRIYDEAPSVIAGQIKADGHLYFINANGIIFADGAQVNVGSLTASSLDVSDALFEAGILSNPNLPVFSGTSGFVRVDHGANITTASGGRVMLLAPDVTNSGVINTPDGQTILAAGKSVYLLASDDPAGLLVEVNSGGTATNLGEIVAQRGNVTLVGLAVNQQGRISASTSVRANGSIRLLARDTAKVTSSTANGETIYDLDAQRGGVLTLGENSVTEVTVETADPEKVLGTQEVKKSYVEMSGGVIDINGSIIAHGGNVSATAAFNPMLPNDGASVDSVVNATRIHLGDGALIDVSGVDATTSMDSNQLAIQLFSEQLKDTPLLRGTDWVGKTIYVDKRKGTALVSDDALAAAANLKGQTIAERMSTGGTVTLNAERGDVVMQSGAVVDVSGGSVTYEGGYIRESQVLYKGRKIAVSDADRNTLYSGLADEYSQTNKKWGVTRSWSLGGGLGQYNDTYTDGSAAGSVSISTTDSALNGTFRANTKPGTRQRESLPSGGSFDFKLLTSVHVPNISIVDNITTSLADDFMAVGEYDESTGKYAQGSLLQGDEVQIGTDLFSNGFTSVKLDAYSGAINVDAAISAVPDSTVSLTTSGNMAVNADIVAPGGDITLSAGTMQVADGVSIDASGLYTNDFQGAAGAGTGAVALDGGNVSLLMKVDSEGGLTLGHGVSIAADAGAWVKADGKVKGGDGGRVTLEGVRSLDGTALSAYGFGKGGSLSLMTADNLQAGGIRPTAPNTFWLSETFFGQGGFSGYTLKTSLDTSNILIGDTAGTATTIKPTAQKLVMTNDYRNHANGTDIAKVANRIVPAEYQREAGSVAFESAGSLTLAENATIRTDKPSVGKGGALSLQSYGQMTLLGDVIAPSGTIQAGVTRKLNTQAYDGKLSLYVGENATLSTAGSYMRTPSSDGRIHAEVRDAGSIQINGGEVATVVLKEGSLLDVSGTSGIADVQNGSAFQRQTLHGDAGQISITSRNGMALDGDMHAAASGTGVDGSLTLRFDGLEDTSSGNGNPNGGRVFTVMQNKQLLATGLQAGDDVTSLIGGASVAADQIAQAGFGRVTLDADRSIAGDKVVLADNVNFKTQDALTIRTANLEVSGSGTTTLASTYVRLGTDGSDAATPVAGDSELVVNAQYIDVVGNMGVSGVDKTTLSAQKDIRVRGKAATVQGTFATPGTLALNARQIYPATNSRYLLKATGPNSRIEIGQNGQAQPSVLSAGGRLTLQADDIVQGGTLLAPMGQITLDAANSLTLLSGSLTSVSAKGMLIPYGMTALGGLLWDDPTASIDASTLNNPTTPPEKKVELSSDNVDMQAGATVDVSGGGDLLAYEWIEGIGGSTDILGQLGVYAVLPSYRDGFAPYDYNYSLARDVDASGNYTGSERTDITVGDSVFLSGIPGLAEGTYTLLPARYALLPGAFMVQATSGNSMALGASIAQADGSSLVSGYRLNGSSRDSLNSVFKVTSGNIFHTAEGEVSKAPSQYLLTSGNEYFSQLAKDAGKDIPRLASDAGQLTIAASDSLALNASIVTTTSGDARGALVDVVSDKISVVSETGVDDGTLQLTAGSLNALNAESLLLGGQRTQTDDGYSIATTASSVVIDNDADHALKVNELIAIADDTLTVKNGSVIETLAATGTPGASKLGTQGAGALLAISSRNDLQFERTGASSSAGTLSIGSGAQVSAARSLVLDSTSASNLEGNINVADNGTVTLGANRIVLGEADASVSGLHVSDALLDSFGELSGVTLNSYKNVDIHGPVNLGKQDLDLTINAAGIAGHMETNEAATLTARDFTLKNTLGAVYETTTAASGSALNVEAQNIALVGGAASTSTTIGGFEQVKLAAAKEVIFSGSGTTTIDAQQTHISSTRMTAATGADYTLKATGSLSSASAANMAVLKAAQGLGAKVTVAAADLTLGGTVDMPSGNFTAQATSGDLTVANGAIVRTRSIATAFDKNVEYTPGGAVMLKSDSGNISVDAGAVVDVSGEGDASAGNITLTAASGAATVDGSLVGKGGSEGGDSGRFSLDVASQADFGAINDKLNDGGFNASREFRVRTGDVSVTADDSVKAEQVVISADAGNLNVAGKIDASADKKGVIGLYGGNGVTLNSTAQLVASSSEAGAEGGTVEIATSNGYLDLQSGSQVDVSGGVDGKGGELRLRAPRTSDNKDIQITAVSATVQGASAIRAEGFKAYADNSINSADVATTGTWYKEAESFMKSALTGATAGLNRLGKKSDPLFTIVPGLEISNTAGDVALANDWSLQGWRFDADTGVGVTTATNLNSGVDSEGHALLAGVLTLRASGNLNLNNSLNDGFSVTGSSFNFATSNAQEGGSSWSYNLVGGADFAAANVMATKSAGSVNMPTSTAAAPEGVRTGTGDIRIAAGGNLDMKNENTVIYTGGHQADAWGSFAKSSSYLSDGGDIDIRVAGDILGKLPASGNTQLVNHWLWRQGGGTMNKPVSWWVRPDLFRQGVAALGGGDISVSAGGLISNFSVSVPTTARYDSNGNASIQGGGDVDIRSGGDIVSGVYYAGKGDITLASGGEIKADSTSFGTTLALQDASATISALRSANIETVFNPTMWAQMNANASSLDTTGNNAYYLTYGQDSSIDVSSLTGNVSLGTADVGKITGDLISSGNITARSNESARDGLAIMPGMVKATAYSGDINVGRAILAPAEQGDLKLLADGNISARSTTSAVIVSDADRAVLASVSNPRNMTQLAETVSQIKNGHSATPVHINDVTPVAIVARNGSISGPSSANGLEITSAKAAEIVAGKDISISASIQNVRNSDLTTIKAGRDIVMPTDSSSKLHVAGPGNVLVQAGRNISLGTSQGIVTTANTENSNLPENGASITVLAGAGGSGANVDGYVSTYIDPAGSGPSTLQEDLADYRSKTAQAVATYMRGLTGNEHLGEAEAMTQYLALDADRKAVFAYRHLSSELAASGAAFPETGNHERGDTAIASMFPKERGYLGDLSLYNSQIRTYKNGSIDILAPGGLVNVGVPSSSGNEIGIVTEKGGDIRVFAEDGFQVEQSKVITQYGSDITVWVNNGDIDAGRGSKTAVSVPDRVVSTDKDGNTIVEVKGAASGSGIRAQTYDPDGPNGSKQAPELGKVTLIAPRGILDLGEAGVGGGEILLVTQDVIGLGGLDGNNVTGAPAADTSSLAATAGIGNVGSEATRSASEEVAKQVADAATNPLLPQNFMPALVSVEVIGLGD